jgi:predicted TIM-barrel fold metal-dependent hydrolase
MHMRVDRRAFLAGALGAITLGQVAGAAARTGVPIIDTHQHLWDLKKFDLPWLKGDGRLNRSFTEEDYAKAVEGLDVMKAVYEEVDVVPSHRQAEVDYVVDLCRSKRTRTVAAIVGGDPASQGFEKYVTAFKRSPYIKGLRHGYPRGGIQDQAFVKGVRLLGELGLSFDLNMGSDLAAESAQLVEACPGTRFVLDHCGNPNVKWFADSAGENEAFRRERKRWEDGITRLAGLKNVVCKISGVAESGHEGKVTAPVVAPVINFCLDRFGEDRVMFASNWPVCLKTITLANWVGVLKEVVKGRGEKFARKLFSENAARFFGL